ncbi:hypothetical protein BYT27DRAFT_7337818 [Phlegmacium glaucopus]|nr:hypothetical protein BYT27DRAFT_7337818 [Phlegmacium glaucopus]
MGHLIKARFSSIRTDVREIAAHKSESHYQLRAGPGCAAKVKALLKDDAFIFSADDKGLPISSKPYCHDAIIAVLQWFFKDKSSIGRHNASHLKSSMPDHAEHSKELEIPVAMLAFSVTMLYVELLDWRTGKQVRSKFNADELVSTYQHHVNVINAI